jgi:hypothetical protein
MNIKELQIYLLLTLNTAMQSLIKLWDDEKSSTGKIVMAYGGALFTVIQCETAKLTEHPDVLHAKKLLHEVEVSLLNQGIL